MTSRVAVTLAAALLVLFGAGCGNDDDLADEAPESRPQLTIPEGSVESSGGDEEEATGETGATDESAQSQTVPSTGDQGTGGVVAPDNSTGGQGTDQNQGTTTPQDTGGAAPGN